MREIKFRAWIDEKSKWSGTSETGMFTGFTLEDIYSGNDEANVYCEGKRIIEEPQWDKIILMQYTGLKDKNGKEIYEGDVLKCKNLTYGNYDIGEVQFGRLGSFVLYLKNIGTGIKVPLLNYISNTMSLVEDKDFEIIGNIHENPELIKDNSESE